MEKSFGPSARLGGFDNNFEYWTKLGSKQMSGGRVSPHLTTTGTYLETASITEYHRPNA